MSNALYNDALKTETDFLTNKATGAGAEAALARLMLRIRTHEVADWLLHELERKEVGPVELINIISTHVSLILATTACSVPNAAPTFLGLLMMGVNQGAHRVINGELKLEGIVIDPKTNRAEMATLSGIFQGKYPFPPKPGEA